MLETTKEFLGYRMAVVFIENQVETVMEDGVAVKKRSKTQDIINAATIQGTFSNRFQITGLEWLMKKMMFKLLFNQEKPPQDQKFTGSRTVDHYS